MKIRIDALDTLFFRDGKPFSSGEDLWGNMLFPPLPSVLYGALHSAYLAELIRKWQPTPTTKTLTIKAVALQRQDGRLLFPAPLDYVKIKGSTKGLLLKERLSSVISNCPANELLTNPVNMIVEPLAQGCFDNDALSAYLQNKEGELAYEELSQYIQSEPKIGIKRDNATHAAQEQMLYSIEMKRLEKRSQGKAVFNTLALFVEYQGISLPKQGILRLGGEGKAASYEPSQAVLPPKPNLTGRRFKLYFASPAIFHAGWRPSWLEHGKYGNLELHLVTAIIGKPIFAGGFSAEHRRPKKMRKAVPAGSVYVFELRKGTIEEAIETFHGATISDSADDCQQGFGLTFVGGVQ